MKPIRTKSILLLFVVCSGLSFVSCNQKSKQHDSPEPTKVVQEPVLLKDYGAEPTVLDIDNYTTTNDNFRTVIWTGKNLQVTLMSIPVGGEVGLELHPDIDQFLRIEDGEAKVVIGDTKDALDFIRPAGKDFAIFVPAGKWHNLINTGDKPLKLYSIYAPIEHSHGTIHKTMEESKAAHH